MKSKVIIVGAGPGGLAAAMLLAKAGCQVKVFERLPTVGGRTSAIEAQGFRFDLGPTFFLYPRVLEDVFHEVGMDLHREVELIRLDPQYRIQFGAGGKIDATPDVGAMERQIAAIAPGDANGFRRFLSENSQKLEKFQPFLEQPFSSVRDLLNPSTLKLLPLLRPHLSIDGDLRRYFDDPRIRLAFSFQSKYLGMSPFQCPSLFSILSFLEYAYGVWHPKGGCAAVSQAMARAAERLGAEIFLGEPVDAVRFNGRRATGVKTRSGEHTADAVVMNADFARAMQSLVPNELRSRWTDKRLAGKRYSCSTFMLYLGIKGRFDLPHHTIHISSTYEENLKDIEERHVLSSEPSFYVQNACVTDPALAPKGHSTLYVLAPVTHQHPNVDWRLEAPRFRRRILEAIAQAGYADVEHRIRYERMITPAEWDTRYEIYRGATFNLAHSLDQLLHLRPNNRFEDLDGVYLVGGGTHPGSGLPVIFESARITSGLVCEDLGLRRETPPRRAQKPSLVSSR